MKLGALLLVLLALMPLQAGAQARQSSPRPRPEPPVDPLTASISGRITAAHNGAPVRGAEVRAVSDSGVNRLATTDADGRYEIRDLPAGRFRIAVSKSGFAPAEYGQRHPSEAPVRIALTQGKQVTGHVTMLRGGVIAGRVFDRFGEPAAGIIVQALRARMAGGQRRLQPVASADETDDRGSFRVYGLAPGDYYLVARRPRVKDMAQRGDLPIFYPGTADFTEAQRIAVAAASESSVLIQLVDVQTATVSGVVLGPSGAPVDATVSLTSHGLGLGDMNAIQDSMPFGLSTHAEADGTFTLTDVPPGPYSLRADSVVRPVETGPGLVSATSAPSHLIGTMPLNVGGDVAGLAMTLSAGGSATGSFVRDPGASAPLPPGLGVRATGGGMAMHMTGPNNTFRLMGMHGRVRLAVENLPESWTIKSIVANDTDVTDTGIDMTNGGTWDVRIVLTDRVSEVSGTVASRAPLAGQTVVVFADDPARWTYPSRFVRTARVNESGQFTISGLPPDRYLATAVEFLEEGETEDPQVLERLRNGATPFTIGEGERHTVELRTRAR